MNMSDNVGAIRHALMSYPPIGFALWTMSRHQLADGNDPLLLALFPIGFVAGIWFAISQRRWFLAWIENQPRRYIYAIPTFGIGAACFLFGSANAINGTFADRETREVSGKVSFFCCRSDDEPTIRMVPDAEPGREINFNVTPNEYLKLRSIGVPVAVRLRRGLLRRDLVVDYRLLPVTPAPPSAPKRP
ncbi:MAG: hypothetical protein WD801_01635 [Gemmatimonadaceae bacterium]